MCITPSPVSFRVIDSCEDSLMIVPSSSPLHTAAPWWRHSPGRVLRVRGGRPLTGTYPISGAKNAALPLMVATLLTPHLVTLRNLPASLDVAVLAALLQRLGANLNWSRAGGALSLTVGADRIHPAGIDPDLVARMRASVLLLGALLARSGEARLPMPGGDAIGLRGIDFHVAGLRAMGAEVEIAGGMIEARAPRGLKGAGIRLPQPSVGATENLMLAAVLAEGTTTIAHAAREPEVADLATCLNAMGAAIEGAGSDTLIIRGGQPLGGAVHAVMPDRIELGTLAIAAALTGGELLLAGGRLDLLGAAGTVFAAAGVELTEVEGGLLARASAAGLTGVDIVTRPWPGFATDLQPQGMVLLALAQGAGLVSETIFDSRMGHVDELRRLGADITVRGSTALVRGVAGLKGATVTGRDVRAAAALVIAGLAASGETVLDGLEHLDRGYDGMAAKLAACGADVERSAG